MFNQKLKIGPLWRNVKTNNSLSLNIKWWKKGLVTDLDQGCFSRSRNPYGGHGYNDNIRKISHSFHHKVNGPTKIIKSRTSYIYQNWDAKNKTCPKIMKKKKQTGVDDLFVKKRKQISSSTNY